MNHLLFESALLIEDELNLATALQVALKKLNISTHHVTTLAHAREKIAEFSPELIILDRALPDGDGLDLCANLRAEQYRGVILILTASGQLKDRVSGLNAGADDYLPKPFSWDELEARLRALARRKFISTPSPLVGSHSQGKSNESAKDSSSSAHSSVHSSDHSLSHTLVHSPTPMQDSLIKSEHSAFTSGLVNTMADCLWTIDRSNLKIMGPKGWVTLTPLEFKLASAMIQNANRIISRDDLLKDVWGFTLLPKTRTVDHFLGRLRKYFEHNPEHPKFFQTIRGAGYKFQP